jgi:hypothetical protein
MASRSLPPRPIRFAQFLAIHYPGLNGDHPLAATKLEIERSLLMVGYANAHSATATVGPWRATLLSALVEGYLTSSLAASPYFLALEPSERVSMTFLLAQAFTHWAADFHMSVPILLHLKGTTPRWTVASASVASKTGAGPSKKGGRPDFIGIEPGAFHMFESKGRSLQTGSSSRSSTIAAGCMPAALSQVSRIARVGGSAPKTRTAAVWVLRATELRGFVTDPPETEESYDLEFDLRKALLKYYRIVLDLPAERQETPDGIIFFNLSETRSLAIHAKLPGLLRGLENDLTKPEQILNLLGDNQSFLRVFRRTAAGTSGVAIGLDGVALIDRTFASE